MARKQLAKAHLSSYDTKASYSKIHEALTDEGFRGEKSIGHFWEWQIDDSFWAYTRIARSGERQWIFIDSKLGELKNLLATLEGIHSQKSMTPNAKFTKFGGWARHDGSIQTAGWKLAFSDRISTLAFVEVIKAFSKGGIDAAKTASQRYAMTPARSTSKSTVAIVRIGQNIYRNELISYWKGCAVTGCDVSAVLKASHIKPWSAADERERMDPFNGILLSATLDALFDRGLISFSDTGEMLVSGGLGERNLQALGIASSLKLRKLNGAHLPYLRYHREVLFAKHVTPTLFAHGHHDRTTT